MNFFRYPVFLLALLLPAISFAQTEGEEAPLTDDQKMVKSIYEEVLVHGQCYDNLRYLCKVIGHRLSGSEGAAKAVTWGKEVMEKLGADKVWLQDVMVPHWERGEKENAFIAAPGLKRQEVPICALGGSVGTGKSGLTAQVIEVQSLKDLEKLGRKKIEGKIVFYNRPFDPKFIDAFQAYGSCVDQRSSGAVEAAKYGAIGTVVRSMTHSLDDFPHTGAMRYVDTIPKIPAVAISTNGAELLSRLLRQSPNLNFHFRTTCQTLPDAPSHNVVGEIRGSEFPNEIIVIGGHLDSWDLGEGAHDDGAGIVQSMEVLRIIKALGLKPKRTIRAVLFINEENGMKGALKYEEIAREKGEKHIAGLESDRGGFSPRGFSIDGSPDQITYLQDWQDLLEPYFVHTIHPGYGGVDISPFRSHGIPLVGLVPDSQRYFDYHHCANDVFENVNKRELELGSATMAALVWLISEHGLNQ
ncbi:MAG: M20/M25/M40 family metallo-hydrolase [Bacteroidia bacterium]|nr:M20/M25/M40 family metallo-hydrolase [Bacteroidia bacterium]